MWITLLGHHLASQAGLTFEVITRRLEDRGGGLASINGKPRLLEGLTMPSEEDEFDLSFYNSMTTWIDLDQLLSLFELDREDIFARDESKISAAIRKVAADPNLSHSQGRKEEMGTWPRRHLPGNPV